ncbi:aminoglycoside phosphotransferase [Thioclava dalianensis]|uniref:Aminoglycoside phosphotransferase n=1 Tax=Thioclava dalianensis TaxID=1185766 RepID=A0A074U518_9RHOB|nr:phosphotransferase [Thioclava dalianensis]KEP69722.1 aminoglycoside phosphotransferase [Thioclava dalianensis]SFM93511.1 Ser/Thr protein kinase RdoA involved in Cpx stress response, MazF antagonist [Thioclava dalianensis]
MTDGADMLWAAHDALQAWDADKTAPRLVSHRENIVFDASLNGGRRIALRLHRPGYQERAAIEAELNWCAALAARGLPVPRPVPSRTGTLTVQAGPRLASCVDWLDGTPIGAGDQPLGPDAASVARDARALGRLIAQLHNATDAHPPAPFPRPVWDAEGLLGETPLWGRFWEHPALTPPQRDCLGQARALAADTLKAVTDFGPIHADILRENVLKTDRGLALIDFDDCGTGYRLYDLGTALIQGWGDPLWAAQVAGLTEGYRSQRSLPDDQIRLLPVLVALRGFASAGWIVTRATGDDSRQMSYVRRALALAQHVINQTTPWER